MIDHKLEAIEIKGKLNFTLHQLVKLALIPVFPCGMPQVAILDPLLFSIYAKLARGVLGLFTNFYTLFRYLLLQVN